MKSNSLDELTTHTFFLIVNPGLEDLALHELLAKAKEHSLNIINYTQTNAGIEFSAVLAVGLSLNHYLKIPTRILLRISEFKVRDFPKLYNKIKKTKWSDFLYGEIPKIKASTVQSRLLHSGRIEKTIQDGILKYYQENQMKQKYLELKNLDQDKTVYARIVDDLMTLSIDTSGTALYKRNNWSYRAPAALRETFSAAIYYDFILSIPSKVTTLFDPFAGSGTILVEAINFNKPTKKEFSYSYFPLNKDDIKPQNIPLESLETIEKLKALEIDSNTFNNVKAQLAEYKKIEYLNQDCFSYSNQEDFILTNPPYGVRLKKAESTLASIVYKLYQNYRFKYLGILHVEGFKETNELMLVKKRKFSNNSIDVYFNIIKAKDA